MRLERVLRLIDQVADMGVQEFLLTGGEPLIREDLPQIVDYLGRTGVNWSLNTAAMPSHSLRTSIERSRPGFVAISLDGPEEVHDSFRGRSGAWREALDSIEYFRGLDGVRVCAGTTVTRLNFPHLDETFHLAVASGVDQWGIHLLVPEGRASLRSDLFPDRKQLRRLIRFIARKRQVFAVEMADEIGYLGHFEPLVRDLPMSCGAGRSQCVVLPDGEVVPCTTLDRSHSAGNLEERTLEKIWLEGFEEIRSWVPEDKCANCIYGPACRGGCWLQRKAGRECFRGVWHVPDALKTAAGVAVCLGGIAATALADEPESSTAAVPVETTATTEQWVDPLYMDQAILGYYVDQLVGQSWQRSVLDLAPEGWDDPAWEVFRLVRLSALPYQLESRCELAALALQTEQRSLSIAALSWRIICEPLMGPDPVEPCSGEERELIRSTLHEIDEWARECRERQFSERLDPYLDRGRYSWPPRFLYSKAGPRPGELEHYMLLTDLNEERWGVAEEYLELHPWADHMLLTFTVSGDGRVELPGRQVEHGDTASMGLFELVQASGGDVTLEFEVSAELGSTNSPYDYDRLGRREADLVGRELTFSVSVELGRGDELLYAELLGKVYLEEREKLLRVALDWMSSNPAYPLPEYPDSGLSIGGISSNEPVLWPAIREIALDPDESLDSLISEGELRIAPDELRRRALLKDIDFWMF
jgi:radical SAM protein with 4Fe4S-binding SPASM domain